MKRFAAGLVSALLAISLVACSGTQGQRSSTGGTASGTATGTVKSKSVKMPVGKTGTVGQWKVTVVSIKKSSRSATMSAPGSTTATRQTMTFMAMVRMQNTGTAAMTTNRNDWALVEATAGPYKPVAVGRTSVTVNPGKMKAMVLTFRVPQTQGASYVLKFQPASGGGVMEVPVP